MPVYMGSRFLARTGRDQSKVVQEALADLKNDYNYNNDDGVVDEDDNVSNEHFAAAILMKADNRALVSDCGSTMGL